MNIDSLNIRSTEARFINYSRIPTADYSSAIVQMNISKRLSMQPGTFVVDLVPAPTNGELVTQAEWESYLLRDIRPMDIVEIAIGEESANGIGNTWKTMLGVVSRVHRSRTQTGNSVSRSITISGMDFTKYFYVDSVTPSPELVSNEAAKEFFKDDDARLKFLIYSRGTEDDGTNIFYQGYNLPRVLYWILAKIPAMRIDEIGGYGKKKLCEMFKAAFTAFEDDRVWDISMTSYVGNISNFMNVAIDKDFYELWVDTLPKNTVGNDGGYARPVVFCRPKPYDRKTDVDSEGVAVKRAGVCVDGDSPLAGAGVKKYELPAWDDLTSPVLDDSPKIYNDEILNDNTGVSDEEVFTMYRLIGDKDILANGVIGKFGAMFPLLDLGMIRAYGMRMLSGASRLLPYAVGQWEILAKGDIAKADIDSGVKMNKLGIQTSVRTTQRTDIATADCSTDEFLKVTRKKRDRLWRWNRYNHILESGSFTIIGRPMYVGTKVNMPERGNRGIVSANNQGVFVHINEAGGGMDYYVVGVDDSYAKGQSPAWTTTLHVSRGNNAQQIKNYDIVRGFADANGNGKPAGKDNSILAVNTWVQTE